MPSAASGKRPKYRNRKTTVGGIEFDSKREAERWSELLAMQAAGLIAGLRRQVRFPLVVNGQRVCAYVADFVYVMGGRRVVEDVKSEFTRRLPVYRIKRKLMFACHGIEIQEV
jgi:hypothetical protein